MCFISHMTVACLTVMIFSLSIYGAQTPCTTDGWFGPDCQYQCHCAGSAPCDKHDGSCSSGCHQDWFGPACQYARMGFTVTGNFNSSWLTDNKDTTCNRENLRSVTVTLDTPIPLTWLRVVVSDAVHLNTVKISYANESSNGTECPESNTAEINRVSADISCPTEYPVTSVTLSGRGVNFLCSLYISAGRNVALRQRAEQSTWFNDGSYYLWWAEYAVDGKIPTTNEKRSSQNTCTHTALHDRSPWWKVSFTQPVEITRFIIENRRDCCQERLKNFSLTVYPVTDSYRPITFRGPDEVKSTYSVVPSPRISFPVREVKITEGFNPKKILTLCEVFIFGETRCVKNRYGLRCERECNCANQTSCFVHSGSCPSGCAPGYTGLECSQECETGRDVTQSTQGDYVKIPVALHVGRRTLVTRPIEHVRRDVTQATQGDSVKIPAALHVVGRTNLVIRLMESVHKDVIQATQGDCVKTPAALHVVGRTTLVIRLIEPVHRDVT
ncbi:hypothetical protein RRG08_000544 [Elysia crispata]|uniref:Fucolectin tachylectin-4 pentraxin-1 domain-containing protein n=1 Tax=Elysia crispata TaxID=231223 RepID=A0AAE0YDC0_9GAST|nr:hypothetical protein RRG08_000544 [Elysia crispata]